MDRIDNVFIQKIAMENLNEELAEEYYQLAKTYIYEKNYDKAEKFLLKAKNVSPAKKIDEALVKINTLSRKPKACYSLFNNSKNQEFDRLENSSGHHITGSKNATECSPKAKKYRNSQKKHYSHKKQSNGTKMEYAIFSKDKNQAESEQCVANAEQHMARANYSQAEQLLLKAKRLHPTKNIDALLAKLYVLYNQNYKTDSKNFQSIQEAKRSVELAQECLEQRCYKKAKKLLLKAKRLNPSIKIETKLGEIDKLMIQEQDEIRRMKEIMNKDEADRCIQIAESLIANKKCEEAKKMLYKAKHLHSSSKVDGLLEQLVQNSQPQQGKKSEYYFFRIDMNKDEAKRCVEIAVQYMSNKNYEKAKDFLLKAQKLFPMTETAVKLAKVESILRNKSQNERNPSSSQNENNKRESQESKFSNSQNYYTQEQLNYVNAVLKCRVDDYYCILSVKTTATIEELKKAYKTLVLKIHPDKNHAPGAEDAFKRVDKAFKELQKRIGMKSNQFNFSQDSTRNSQFNSSDNFTRNNKSKSSEYSNRNTYNSSQNSNKNDDFKSSKNNNFAQSGHDTYSNFSKNSNKNTYSNHSQDFNNFDFSEGFRKFNYQYDNTFYSEPRFYGTDCFDSQPYSSKPVYSIKKLIVFGIIFVVAIICINKYFTAEPKQSERFVSFMVPQTGKPLKGASIMTGPNESSFYVLWKSAGSIFYYTCKILLRVVEITASLISKIASSTYNVVKEVEWNQYFNAGLSLISTCTTFLYQNTKNCLSLLSDTTVRVYRNVSPEVFDYASQISRSGYNYVIGINWTAALKRISSFFMSWVPWNKFNQTQSVETNYDWNSIFNRSVSYCTSYIPWDLFSRNQRDYFSWNSISSCLKSGYQMMNSAFFVMLNFVSNIFREK